MDGCRRVHSLSARSFKVLHLMLSRVGRIVGVDQIPERTELVSRFPSSGGLDCNAEGILIYQTRLKLDKTRHLIFGLRNAFPCRVSSHNFLD